MQKNQIIVYLACFPARLLLAYAAYHYRNTHRVAISAIAAIIGIGFAVSQFRRTDNPGTGAFGSERYWNNYIHALLYLIFAALCFYGYDKAAAVLVLDVIVGFIVVTMHYNSIENDAKK